MEEFRNFPVLPSFRLSSTDFKGGRSCIIHYTSTGVMRKRHHTDVEFNTGKELFRILINSEEEMDEEIDLEESDGDEFNEGGILLQNLLGPDVTVPTTSLFLSGGRRGKQDFLGYHSLA